MAIDSCKPGEVYNICSGQGLVLQEIVDTFLSLSEKKDIKLVKIQGGKRPTNGEIMIGEHVKFTRATG